MSPFDACNLRSWYCVIKKEDEKLQGIPRIILEHNKKRWRPQWPRGLMHEPSSPAQTLESWDRIPLEAWMCMCVYSLSVLSCVQVAALRRAVPPSKESCRVWNWKSGQGPIKGCFLLGLSFDLKMEATCSSETSVAFPRTTRHHILEDRTLHDRCSENFTSYIHKLALPVPLLNANRHPIFLAVMGLEKLLAFCPVVRINVGLWFRSNSHHMKYSYSSNSELVQIWMSWTIYVSQFKYLPSNLAKAVMLLTCLRQVTCSNLALDTKYPDWGLS
jgi:hypothetical protein